MPETDKLLTDLHISYIQGLGQAGGFFLSEPGSDFAFLEQR